MNKFSPDFLLGAATAAHQVEGNNDNSDCWAMEQMEHTSFIEPSLDAVDHYHRYQEDIRLMADAGLNAYRFSVEWARIEPEEGHFDDAQAEHYLDVIHCCKEHGLEPIVTLHHFSSPKWLIGKGGWEAESTVDDFARYVRYIIGKLGNELHYVCTINEANMGIQVAAIAKRYMLQMQAQAAKAQSADGTVQVGINLEKMMADQKATAEENIKVFGVEKVENFTSMRTPEGDKIVCRAHETARAVIKELYPEIKVGLTLSLHDIQSTAGGEANMEKLWDEEFRHYLPGIRDDDFIGVQNYTRELVGPEGSVTVPDGADITQCGYEFYPEGLEHVIRKVAKDFKGDIYVTENGVTTDDDRRRIEFIQRAIWGVKRCMEDDIPVKGYFYWSFIDNYEWQKAYSLRYGLVAVDRTTQIRTPKPSLRFLGSMLEKEA